MMGLVNLRPWKLEDAASLTSIANNRNIYNNILNNLFAFAHATGSFKIDLPRFIRQNIVQTFFHNINYILKNMAKWNSQSIQLRDNYD